MTSFTTWSAMFRSTATTGSDGDVDDMAIWCLVLVWSDHGEMEREDW